MTQISVETSQNVTITYPIASLGKRILAYFIDGFILQLTIYLIVFLPVAMAGELFLESPSNMYFVFALMGVFAFYHLIMEYFFNGQSIGKMLVGTRVIMTDGTPASIGNYLLRWLLRPIDVLISYGFLAIISISVTQLRQRVGDILAGTTVVDINKQKKRRPNFSNLESGDPSQVVFQEVANLTERDMRRLEEIYFQLINGSYDPYLVKKMLIRLKSSLMKKMALEKTDLEARAFLRQVWKDYRNYHY